MNDPVIEITEIAEARVASLEAELVQQRLELFWIHHQAGTEMVPLQLAIPPLPHNHFINRARRSAAEEAVALVRAFLGRRPTAAELRATLNQGGIMTDEDPEFVVLCAVDFLAGNLEAFDRVDSFQA